VETLSGSVLQPLFWGDWLGSPPLEWLAFAAGLIGVYLSIRERIAAWPPLMFSTAVYIYYCVVYGLFIQTASLLIYFGLCGYGWMRWRASAKAASGTTQDTGPIIRPAAMPLLVMLTLWLALTALIAMPVIHFEASAFPWLESFALIGSLLAQWMVARKWLSAWPAWIFVNVATIMLYVAIGMFLTAILYFLFLGLAVSGWLQWSRKWRSDAVS
jgi:nicotinamide mononucleotide transporter